MAKQYNLQFHQEESEAIEEVAWKARLSGRAWIMDLVLKEVKRLAELQRAFDNPISTYWFKMKDGRVLRGIGIKPGGAWSGLGFKLDQMGLMEMYLLEADAKEQGWALQDVADGAISDIPRLEVRVVDPLPLEVVKEVQRGDDGMSMNFEQPLEGVDDLPFGK